MSDPWLAAWRVGATIREAVAWIARAAIVVFVAVVAVVAVMWATP